MSKIILIRHSLTDGNTQRLYYGSTDLPINEKGQTLCAELKNSFDLPENCRFGCTDLIRTHQTLNGLFGVAPEQVFPLLREMDMGRCEMHPYEELKDDPDFVAWCDDTTGDMVMPDGLESINSFCERVMRGLNEVIDARFYPSLIVCHGGTISWIMQKLFPEEEKNFYEWIPNACKGYALQIEDGKVTGYERID